MNKMIEILGCEGFIGKNLFNYYLDSDYYVRGLDKKSKSESIRNKQNVVLNVSTDPVGEKDTCDFTTETEKITLHYPEIIINAAATTSGANDIVNKPYLHVTDNAIMNAKILQEICNFNSSFTSPALFVNRGPVKHYIFFSCTVMYPQDLNRAVKEDDFTGEIADQYFGVGWTKVYIEKLMKFYSRLLPNTKFTVIRHSNMYGPHDKFDLDKSHVMGATINKVLTTPNKGCIEVWGDGSTIRDLLYIDDLLEFVNLAIEKQESNFEIYNVGSGEPVSVSKLVETVIDVSKKNLVVKYNKDKPSFKGGLWLDYKKANKDFGWVPKTSLREGIEKTINWLHNRIVEL